MPHFVHAEAMAGVFVDAEMGELTARSSALERVHNVRDIDPGERANIRILLALD